MQIRRARKLIRLVALGFATFWLIHLVNLPNLNLSSSVMAADNYSSAAVDPFTIKDTNYPIPSGAYFVAVDGKDTNPGTQDAPWQSLEHAHKAATNGATIVFRAGTYRIAAENIIDKKLTLQPYPHEQVWLTGSEIVSEWVQDGNIWRKDDWKYQFPSRSGEERFIDGAYPLAGNGDMVFLNGTLLTQVGSRDQVKPGTFYVDYSSQKLYIGDNPTGKSVEATVATRAIGMYLQGSSNAKGSVIQGLGCRHFAQSCLEIAVGQVRLENNTFTRNGIEGVALAGESGDIERYTRKGVSLDLVVRSNNFSYNGRTGLQASRAHRLLLEGNIFSHNNVEHFAKDWGAAGFKIVGTDDMMIVDNLVEENDAIGIWLDIGVKRATVVNNVVHRNQSYGIFFEISDGATIASNAIANNSGYGIFITNSSNAKIYNNTLVDNGKALRIQESNRGPNEEYSGQGILEPTWKTEHIIAKNNIFANANGSYDVNAVVDTWRYDWQNAGSKAAMVDALDHNAYYRTNANQPSNLLRLALPPNLIKTYTDLAGLQANTSFEQNGLEIKNVPLNNLFVNAANGNYQLAANSQMYQAGEPLPSDIAAAIGVEAGVAVDMGIL